MSLLSLPRLLNSEAKRYALILSSKSKFSIVQSASITSKEWKDPDVKKPAPWPYKTKKFTYWHALFMKTIHRFDDNTKIIVVDGNIGAGKSELAKQLADAFEMHYVPEPDISEFYITEYGYDLRILNPILPPSYIICDLEAFYKDPFHRNVAQFQFRMYKRRLDEYIDALAHLLNTGQGIVMERSVYSDFVFFEAMYKLGCFRKEVKDLYYDIQKNTIEELLRPHLIVYLDVSPEVALERIKKRNNPIEVNSPVLTKEYLETIEYNYKQKYLKDLEKHAEVLVYDWNNYGDVEVVVEDIERIDFDRFTEYDLKLKDWRRRDDWSWSTQRRKFTNYKQVFYNYSIIPRPSVTEVYHAPADTIAYREIIRKVPGERYSTGFNRELGENVMFKTKEKSYWYPTRYKY